MFTPVTGACLLSSLRLRLRLRRAAQIFSVKVGVVRESVHLTGKGGRGFTPAPLPVGSKPLSVLVADRIHRYDGSPVGRGNVSDCAAQDAIFGDTEATVASAGKRC